MIALHQFQKGLLLKAELTEDKKAQSCYRDCVNFSGVMDYELRSKKKHSVKAIIRATANYQLTRFEVPKEVTDYFKRLPNDFFNNK